MPNPFIPYLRTLAQQLFWRFDDLPKLFDEKLLRALDKNKLIEVALWYRPCAPEVLLKKKGTPNRDQGYPWYSPQRNRGVAASVDEDEWSQLIFKYGRDSEIPFLVRMSRVGQGTLAEHDISDPVLQFLKTVNTPDGFTRIIDLLDAYDVDTLSNLLEVTITDSVVEWAEWDPTHPSQPHAHNCFAYLGKTGPNAMQGYDPWRKFLAKLDREQQEKTPLIFRLTDTGRAKLSRSALGLQGSVANIQSAPTPPAAENMTNLKEFVPADTLAFSEGISKSRLSEAANDGRVATIKAPPGQLDSQGRRVRILYHREDAIRECSAKYVQPGANPLASRNSNSRNQKKPRKS